MNLIGNDIMLLDNVNMHTFARKRARNYVLSNIEKKWVSETCSPNNLIWRWTCKEAAYKIAIKNGYNDAFVPSFFSVLSKTEPIDNKQVNGIILFFNSYYFFSSTCTTQYIHTVVRNSIDKHTVSIKIWENNINYISIIEQTIGNSDIKIIKNEKGIPYLFNQNGIKLNHDISISNDSNINAIVTLL